MQCGGGQCLRLTRTPHAEIAGLQGGGFSVGLCVLLRYEKWWLVPMKEKQYFI